ncbi:MAG: IS110 family transposase, partial [Methanoregula sp.]|nr:IS110 family transposase [Methanoregula sp.]
MTQTLEIAAGLDLHKKFIIATILTLAGGKMQERFERTHEGLLKLKDWILNNKVQAVGCESTSDYAVNIYDLLNQFIPVIVGNARDIKAFTHKKTDKVDSEFIALLTLKGMIHPSRIMSMDLRNFRALTRLRHRLVDQRTTTKNHIHSILDSEMFLLSNAFTDIFGKAGRIVLNGITNGFTVDEILQCIPKNVKGKKRQLREIMEDTLSADALDRMKVNMLILYCYDKQIEDITQKALDFAYSHYPREMKILKSVPGIGEIAAITILAEIGDIKDFPTPEQFASWLGIVPRVYQSADKLHTGSITKRGSVHARWILVQVA